MTLNQIKQEIAALLNVDSVNAKSLFELANSNSVVLTAIQSIDASQFNLRTTETWQAILNKLEGVKEDLSTDVVEVTGNTVNYSEIPVNYQILPLQTKFSHYSYFTLDNQLTYMRFGNEFHPVEVDLDSKSKTVKDLITQEIHLLNDMFFTAFYGNPCNIQETETTSTIVATKTSYNITDFKGIPIEHVTKYDIGLDYPETINDVLLTKFPNYWLVNKSEDVLQFNSFSNAVKYIKEWLGVKQQQVPSPETGNYHYSQMQLTPKLELFSLMTEFVFLMKCYLELTTYFFNLSSSIYDANHQLYLTWNTICSICFKKYVCMPSKGDSTYGILLRIHNQAMKQSSLEHKSIYA